LFAWCLPSPPVRCAQSIFPRIPVLVDRRDDQRSQANNDGENHADNEADEKPRHSFIPVGKPRLAARSTIRLKLSYFRLELIKHTQDLPQEPLIVRTCEATESLLVGHDDNDQSLHARRIILSR